MTVKTLLSDVDIEDIIIKYKSGSYSMKTLAEIYHISHHRVRDILIENNVAIFSNKRNIPKDLREYQIVQRTNYPKHTIESRYKNMIAHIRFDISLKWLMQFEDIEKIKILNKAITDKKERYGNNTKWYKQYIEKFYYDKKFNKIYLAYVNSNYDEYLKPSLDHIIPKSLGGTNELNNLRFITWFENRTKNNLSLERWNYIKEHIQEYLI